MQFSLKHLFLTTAVVAVAAWVAATLHWTAGIGVLWIAGFWFVVFRQSRPAVVFWYILGTALLAYLAPLFIL